MNASASLGISLNMRLVVLTSLLVAACNAPTRKPLADGGMDATVVDATVDAAEDAQDTDAPTDAPIDAPTDATVDTPIDASVDAPVDAAPVDAPTDATPIDAPIDSPTDASLDAPTDAAPTPCPVGPPGADSYGSGTRLCATFHVAPGGAREFVTFHDNQLDVDCVPRPDDATHSLCVPPSITPTTFLSPGCTHPLVVDRTDCPNAYRAVGTGSRGDCSSVRATLHIATHPIQPTVVYLDMFGTCVAAPPDENKIYFDTVAVPADAFVRMTRTPPPPGPDRLAPSPLIGDDGSSAANYIWDRDLATECRLSGANLGDGPLCLPTAIDTGLFGDGGCTSPVGGIRTTCQAQAPAHIVDIERWRVFERGSSISTELYRHSGNTCTQSGSNANFTYFAAGPEIPPEALPRFDWHPRATASRIQPMSYFYGAHPFLDDRFYDSQLGTICTADRTTDGVVRCVPAFGGGRATFYTDAACTVPVDVMTTAAPYAILRTSDACGGTVAVRVWRRGAPISGPFFFTWWGGSPAHWICNGTSTTTAYQLGPELAPEEMVALPRMSQ